MKALSDELVACTGRVGHAHQLAEEDSRTIDELKRKIHAADAAIATERASADAAASGAERHADRCRELEAELARHRELLGEDGSIEKLLAERGMLENKLDSAAHATSEERATVERLGVEIDVRKQRLRARREELRAAERRIAAAASESIVAGKRAASLEGEIARLQAALTSHDATIVHLREQLDRSLERGAALDRQLASLKASSAASEAECTTARHAVRKLEDEVRSERTRCEQAEEDRSALKREVRSLQADLAGERTRHLAAAAARDGEQKEKTRLRSLLDAASFEATKAQGQAEALQKELDHEVGG